MTPIRYTLLADGPSDRCLIPIIDWLVGTLPGTSHRGIISQFADLRSLEERPDTLAGRMCQAIRHYPCDVLFVHRDAEREALSARVREIATAAELAGATGPSVWIPVVPIRMTEAWLLLEPQAIRRAADNPNGAVRLNLPRLGDVESQPNPKQLLDELLVVASEKTGRRLQQFRRDLPLRRIRVAYLIRDFSPLQLVPAFASFAADTRRNLDLWRSAR